MPKDNSQRYKLPLDEATYRAIDEALRRLFNDAPIDPLAWDPNDPHDDPHRDQEAHYRWVRHTLARERTAIHDWAVALGTHVDLQSDLDQYRAVRQDVTDQAAQALAMAIAHEKRVLRQALRQAQDDMHRRGIAWLGRRYWRVIRDAQEVLDLPSFFVIGALRTAMDGSWDAAIRDLEGAPTAAFLHYTRAPMDAMVLRDSDDLRALADVWSRSAVPTSGVLLPLPRPGMGQDDYVAAMTTAIKDVWSDMGQIPAARFAPGRRKGGRPRGGTSEQGYDRRVRLYNVWRAHPTRWKERRDLWQGLPTITWAQFTALVDNSGQFDGWFTEQRTIESATKAAILWAAPDPSVDRSLADFSLDDPRTDAMMTFFDSVS